MDQRNLLRQEFIFLRHGQTDWNVEGRLQGRSDRPLDDDGIAQAHAAADQLMDEKVNLIVSSPLKRAQQTAEVVAKRLGFPVDVDPLLIERSFGSLEGRSLREILPDEHVSLHVASSTTLPPDCEPWEQVCTRALSAVNNWLSNHPAERLLFVSHYGVLSALSQKLCETPAPAKNAMPIRFVPSGREWEMIEVSRG